MICPNCNFKNSTGIYVCERCGSNLFKSRLRIIQSDGESKTYYLFEKDYTIGRSQENDITIPDESISRFHAQLNYEDGSFLINDLNSKNGSLLNNFTFTSEVLRDQDCIQLGNVVIHFYDDSRKLLNPQNLDTLDFVQQEYFKLAENRLNYITMQDVLNTVLELLVSLVNADKGAILEFHTDKTWHERLSRGFKNHKTEISALVQKESSLMGAVLATGETQIKWKNKINSPEDTGTGPFDWHQIALPLLSTLTDEKDKVNKEASILGICFLSNGIKLSKLSRRKKELISALVEQLAVALENELLPGTASKKGVFQEKLTNAMHIQNRLLPIAKPNPAQFNIVSLIEPCEKMSGDYFDLIKISDTTFALAIGDVCGKGISAALLSSTAQAAIRSQIELTTSPERIANNLNRWLMDSTDHSIFLTLFFAILDLETNAFNYVNAGHPPPVFINKNRELKELSGTTPPLGILDELSHPDRTISFEPDDMLIMYTDGLIESQNASKEIYDRKRFTDLVASITQKKANNVSLDDIVGKIKSDLFSFTQGTPRTDDLTLLGIKRKL